MEIHTQIITQRSRRLSHSSKLFSGTILLFFLGMLFNSTISAQAVRSINGVKEANIGESKYLNSLLNDIQPTLYFQECNLVGENVALPLLIDTDVASVKRLYEMHPEYKSVEVIRINIEQHEDLKLLLDISKLSYFNNLKFIYFLCAFEICTDQKTKSACEKEKVKKMLISEENSNITFLYLISIPS